MNDLQSGRKDNGISELEGDIGSFFSSTSHQGIVGVHFFIKKIFVFTPRYLSLFAKVKEDHEKVSGMGRLELVPMTVCSYMTVNDVVKLKV